jgi:hypothetical protein
MDELAALTEQSDDEDGGGEAYRDLMDAAVEDEDDPNGDDAGEGAFRHLMDAAPADEPETPETPAADGGNSAEAQEQDPQSKIAVMVANLEGLEAVATAHGTEPPVPGVPVEGKVMYEELLELRASVDAKKAEIDKLKASTEQHSAAAAEIEAQLAAVEAEHAVELAATAEEQAEERAKTERVLGSMRDARAAEVRQIEANDQAVAALEKVLRTVGWGSRRKRGGIIKPQRNDIIFFALHDCVIPPSPLPSLPPFPSRAVPRGGGDHNG